MCGLGVFHFSSVPVRWLLIGVLAVMPAQGVSGQALPEGHGARIYHAVRVETPPVLDGDLRDPVWQEAAVLADLVQQIPAPGAEASERTEARILTRERFVEVSDELASGDVVRFRLQKSLDRLEATDDPFVIHPRKGILVPPGLYEFNYWTLAYEGFEGRAFRAEVEAQGGGFYGGERASFNVSGTWRPSPHLALSGDYQLNDVRLPQGAFTTHLQRVRVSVPITARAVADAFIQWNGLTQELNTQVRLHLIYGRDSNLYIVFTDQTDVDGRLTQQSRALQTKLAYRWYS